jgi:murein peptide amidase A
MQGPEPGAGPARRVRRERIVGRSARGRAIRLAELGDRTSEREVLVVGCIHGTECAGTRIARRLESARAPAGARLWVIENLNPDGRALGTRLNGRGVDLNRNFPSEWRPIGRRFDPQYSGPRPFSEPETRLARDLVRSIQPDVSIWFHQPQNLVRAWGGSVPAARRYARLAGERFRAIRWPAGTAPNWQNQRFEGMVSFVVELAPGPLSDLAVERHARAVRALLGR